MLSVSRIFIPPGLFAGDPIPESAEAERELRAAIPVYVNSFNQVTYLRQILDWFWLHGFRNVAVLDQNSSYPPLLEYFRSAEFRDRFRLRELGRNIGPIAAAEAETAHRALVPHIFTDPDLELPDPPHDRFLCRLFNISRRHAAMKTGLALDISDAHLFHDGSVLDSKRNLSFGIEDWEQQFWTRPLEPDVYRARVDTTFHLWNPLVPLNRRNVFHRLRGRTPRPREVRVAGEGFVARHRPWYRDNRIPAEEADFYLKEGKSWSNWNQTSVASR